MEVTSIGSAYTLLNLESNAVELGLDWKELITVMWLVAGSVGQPPVVIASTAGYFVAPSSGFGVLRDAGVFTDLVEAIGDDETIKHVFLLTDSEDAYAEMTSRLPGRKTHMWPRDYLRFFRQIAEARS